MSNTIQVKNRLDQKLLSAEIMDISWERIIMKMEVVVTPASGFDMEKPIDFYLVNQLAQSDGRFRIDAVEGNAYHISMHITNPGYRMCLPNGIYTMVICQGDDAIAIPTVSVELAGNLKSRSRMFLHNLLGMGYSVEFLISEQDEDLHLEIIAQDMARKGIDNWRGSKSNKSQKQHQFLVQKAIKKLTSDAAKHKLLKKAYNHYLKKHRHDAKKNVLFLSEQNENPGANLVCVKNRMIERGLDQQYNLLSSSRNVVGKGGYGLKSWVHVMELAAQADVLFVDDHVPFMDWLVLDDKTKVIQIWHAGAGYKSIGYSRWGNSGSPRAFSAHRQYDFGITPSENIAFFFSEQFGMNEEQILPTGMPRMDSYIDPANREKVTARLYEQYPMLKGKRVILFAPTYRGGNKKTAHYPYEIIDFDRLYDFCGEDTVILFKMHPWVPDAVPIKESQKDRFLDMNKYPVINDLFYITDLLITDYSSSTFEFSLMRKPMLFFAFDEYQYMYSRGFHRDYRPACPGKIVGTFDELMQALETEDFEFYKNEPYLKYHYDRIDSGATDRVIDWFILDQMPQKYKDKLAQIDRDNERLKALDFSSVKPPVES